MPLVSVVVPTFNGAALLRQTLATVFAQTFADFELIVVDDGSTDETPAMLAAIADARLRVIRQWNAGIGAARNRGIDEARGRYVALLDHDDLWHRDKIATQVAFLDAHPDVVACCTPWERTDQPGVDRFDRTAICDARGVVENPVATLATGCDFLITSCLCFDRERARDARYETRTDCVEDTPFQLELFARGPFGVAGDSILMTYRVHAANHSKRAAFFVNGQRMMRELAAAGRFDGLPAGQLAELPRLLAYSGRTAVARAIAAGDRRSAIHLYRGEFAAQLRDRRLKFLSSVPILTAMPAALARRLVGR